MVGLETVLYVSFSFGAGYIMGLALRKAASLLLTVTGLYSLSLMTLANMGVISINWSALIDLVRTVTGYALNPLLGASVLTLPVATGMLVGFLFSRMSLSPRKNYWVRE